MGNSKTKPEPSKESEANDTRSSNSQLQVRNCIANVRNNGDRSFPDLYPNPHCLNGLYLHD